MRVRTRIADRDRIRRDDNGAELLLGYIQASRTNKETDVLKFYTAILELPGKLMVRIHHAATITAS